MSREKAELTKPTFMVKELPPDVQALKQTIVDADCYVIVSPEYNHTVPPALASLMGHFGGSCYACKPSAIVTYSNGPWGGMRAAMSIQVMAHELGCLPGASMKKRVMKVNDVW
jgi:NAD(P)H-dependent FMN reductase